jgi:ketosteroid isomerase-like protein
MAEDPNLDRLRELIGEFDANGMSAVLPSLHPEIEWHAPQEWLEQKLYRGRDEVEKLGEYWLGQFEDYRVDLVDVVDVGDGRVVALLFQRGRIKESGAEVEQETGWLVEFEDGMMRTNHARFSWTEALELAGLDPAEHLPESPTAG